MLLILVSQKKPVPHIIKFIMAVNVGSISVLYLVNCYSRT